jgi:hypothetical protein
MSIKIRIACGTGALMLFTAGGHAQDVKPRSEDVFHFALPHPGPAVAGQTFEFISSEMGVAGKIVKGAPYSADAVTESTQTLADGNRISRKNTTALYRDAEGRTRREVSLNAIGPWASSADAPTKMVFIHDPVAGFSYTLNEKDKTARKMEGNAMVMSFTSSVTRERLPPPGDVRIAVERQVGEKITAGRAAGAVEAIRVPAPDAKNAKTESLGKRNIEGVEAEGTRTIWTIGAGEIGNERSIDIVSERWYSPELETVVMTRQADPRAGETVYKLTNLRRGNPGPQMFEIPADYTVITEEVPKMLRKLRTEK